MIVSLMFFDNSCLEEMFPFVCLFIRSFTHSNSATYNFTISVSLGLLFLGEGVGIQMNSRSPSLSFCDFWIVLHIGCDFHCVAAQT